MTQTSHSKSGHNAFINEGRDTNQSTSCFYQKLIYLFVLIGSGLVTGSLCFGRVNLDELDANIRTQIGDYVPVMPAPELAKELLLQHISTLSKSKGYITLKIWQEKIYEIGTSIAAIDGFYKEYNKSLVCLNELQLKVTWHLSVLLLKNVVKGGYVFLPLDPSGIEQSDELIADGMKELSIFGKVVLQNAIDEVKRSLTSLYINYQATDCFINSCTMPSLLPNTDTGRTSFGYVLFWMANPYFFSYEQ